MAAIDARMTNEVVALLKMGTPERMVVARLCALGAEHGEATRYVAQLVAMKNQADLADRLRSDALDLFGRGATPDDVVAHFVRAGVDEAASRGEVQRIAQFLASRSDGTGCARCGTPMGPSDAYYDAGGNRVCRRCHSGDSIAAAEVRAFEAQRNEAQLKGMVGQMLVGGLTGAATGIAVIPGASTPRAEWCPNCNSLGIDANRCCLRCGKLVG